MSAKRGAYTRRNTRRFTKKPEHVTIVRTVAAVDKFFSARGQQTPPAAHTFSGVYDHEPKRWVRRK